MNKGSILATVLFHFFVNIMQEVTNMNPVSKCIETRVLIVVVVIIVMINKDLFFKQAEYRNRTISVKETV